MIILLDLRFIYSLALDFVKEKPRMAVCSNPSRHAVSNNLFQLSPLGADYPQLERQSYLTSLGIYDILPAIFRHLAENV
jgi:hypothetical protein